MRQEIMEFMKLNKKCEDCGGKATMGVRDVLQRDNFTTGYVDSEPDGPMHFYCEKHERPSIFRQGPPKNEPHL